VTTDQKAKPVDDIRFGIELFHLMALILFIPIASILLQNWVIFVVGVHLIFTQFAFFVERRKRWGKDLRNAPKATPQPITPEGVRATGLTTADDRDPIHEGDTISIHQFDQFGGDVMPMVEGVVEYRDDVAAFGITITVPRVCDDLEVGAWVPFCYFYGLHEESFVIVKKGIATTPAAVKNGPS
jgi:hypothetical protein